MIEMKESRIFRFWRWLWHKWPFDFGFNWLAERTLSSGIECMDEIGEDWD